MNGNPLNAVDPEGKLAFVLPVIPIVITGTDIAIGAGLGALSYGLDRMFNRPKNPPDVGPPGGFIQGPRRGREYGPNGERLRNYDKPHQGNEKDHVHEYPNGEREELGRDYYPWPRG